MGNCLVKEDKIGMEAVIRTEGLTKLYKMPLEGPPVLALNDLTLEVYPGEVFAMVGPNGSGKTTTLKLLMGLIWPTSGQAWLLGQSPRHVKIKQRIGFLPDGPYFYGHLNAYELLDFYAGLFGMSAAERQKRIPELIELVGLGERGKQRIRTYSKGMVQRIGLAQALLNDPELIFLDEPTSGLDPLGSRDIRDLILGNAEPGQDRLHLFALSGRTGNLLRPGGHPPPWPPVEGGTGPGAAGGPQPDGGPGQRSPSRGPAEAAKPGSPDFGKWPDHD
jgi:ABC-type multidrug transport system ATPase subunit